MKLELKTDVKIIGTYIASTAERINYTALEPKSDIVRFENVENCEIAVVYPDYTALAYNTYGNFSLYTKPFPYQVTWVHLFAYDRPFYSGYIIHTIQQNNLENSRNAAWLCLLKQILH